jgi:hypothetical protein
MVAVFLSFELWLLFVCLLSCGCCLSVFWVMVAVCLSFELWLLFVCLLNYGCCFSTATITQKTDKQQPQLKRQTISNHNSKDRQTATTTQKTDNQQPQLKRQTNSNHNCCLSVFWVMVADCLSFELWLLFVCLLSYGCCLSVFWIMVAVFLSFELCKQQPQLKRQTISNHNSKDRQTATTTQKTDNQQP